MNEHRLGTDFLDIGMIYTLDEKLGRTGEFGVQEIGHL
jgi:hypothetical protein